MVLVDGTPIYDSGLVTDVDAAASVDVPIDGALRLDLVVEDGGDGNVGDAADWADAAVWCRS